jgi:hypothetical protein
MCVKGRNFDGCTARVSLWMVKGRGSLRNRGLGKTMEDIGVICSSQVDEEERQVTRNFM